MPMTHICKVKLIILYIKVNFFISYQKCIVVLYCFAEYLEECYGKMRLPKYIFPASLFGTTFGIAVIIK